MRSLVLAAAALGALAFAAPAVADSSAPGTATTVANANPDQIVCRGTPAPTGSRLGSGRECHTQRQWDQLREEHQKTLENVQMKGLQSGQPGG